MAPGTAKGPLEFPPALVRTVQAAWGEEGEAWLAALPATLELLSKRWSLTVGPPFEGLSYNYVAPALTREGSEVVLKMGLPRRELETEIAALWLYNGRGAVKLLDVNAELGALLLERLRPGTLLVTLRMTTNVRLLPLRS
jgi:streptomycin 6-kinase